MVVTIVTFPTPDSVADSKALINTAAPRYQTIPGLNRKYFIGNKKSVGGVYEWRDRGSAERFFDQTWYQQMTTTYGAQPEVQYFDAPCLVDNLSKRIIKAD